MKVFQVLTVLAVTLVFAVDSHAASIGINFGNGRGDIGGVNGAFPAGTAPTAAAFGIAAGDWNNFGSEDSIPEGPQVATSGSGQSVNVTWDSNNTWTLGNGAGTPAGDAQVYEGYLDDSGNPLPTITVDGLNLIAGLVDYDVTVLLSSADGTGAAFEELRLTTTSPASVLTVLSPAASVPAWGSSGDRIGSETFTGLTSASFTAETLDGPDRGSIAGIIITLNTVPEPTSLLLLSGRAGASCNTPSTSCVRFDSII